MSPTQSKNMHVRVLHDEKSAYFFLESLNKDYLYVSSSNGQTLYDNSTERNLQQEDGSSKSQIQTMHIIEYEEFLPKSRPASSYNNLKEASFEETPIERSKKKALTNNFEQVVLNKGNELNDLMHAR